MPLPDGFFLYLGSERIARRVRELARMMAQDSDPERLVVVGILQGAALLCADLARELDGRVRFDFLRLASYGDETMSSGRVRLVHDLQTDVENQDVILVDDIFDTGLTLRFATGHIASRGARSVRTTALLAKGNAHSDPFRTHWIGFDVPKGYYVGYGLDYAGRFRGMPDIYRRDLP
ncbi:MAG: hypoxanthine phosphoribosyltransferase [Deltaproteobacteria bacterium]|nr:hypoxanthine phosphoribosyltransferase [Deltaproteobacteria bacterium]